MINIVLQPSGNKAAQRHYLDTIKNGIDIDSISIFLSSEQKQSLMEIYPSGKCLIWGATSAGANLNKWTRIKRGDIALFSKKGKIYSSAVVTYKMQNSDLALSLWGKDDGGKNWSLIYFLDELLDQNIPYLDFNKSAGYADNNIIQGFTVMSPQKSQGVLRTFDLASNNYFPDLTQRDFLEVLDKLKMLSQTEMEIISKRRLEQAFLKDFLFGKATIGICGICNNNYPIAFLVAAHLQKRYLSSDEERKNPNIVMPMCTLGCDALYEKGYITVKDGKVNRLKRYINSKTLDNYITSIVGNDCRYYSNETKPFFDWHNKRFQSTL